MLKEIDKWAIDTPNAVAFYYDDRIISYSILRSLIESIQTRLYRCGINKYDVVAISNNNLIVTLASFIAVIRCGGISLPLHSDEKLNSFLLQESNARLHIETHSAHDNHFDISFIQYNSTKNYLNDLLIKTSKIPVSIFPTSGTSGGKRKLVLQSMESLDCTQAYISSTMGLNQDVIEYIGSPPDNVFWYGRVRCCLSSGGTVVISNNSSNPIVALPLIKRYSVNSIASDTSFFLLLLKSFLSRLTSISSNIRWIKLSSQSIPTSKLLSLMDTFPYSKITMGYGLTEAMRTTLINYKDYDSSKYSSVGFPATDDVNIRIMSETGEILKPHEIGEIVVSGCNVAIGYLNNISATNHSFRNGFFHTGDYGYLDEDGFLYFQARIDSAINFGGKKLPPSIFETPLSTLLDSNNFSVIGVSNLDNIMGEVPVLILETSECLKFNNFNDIYKRLLRDYPEVAMLNSVYTTPSIPRTNNGKHKLPPVYESFDYISQLECIWRNYGKE